MESLLAHIARKKREQLRVRRVDVDRHPEIARKFQIEEVPSLALVMEKKVVARIAGRATAPSIESMLDEHLSTAA